MALDLRDCSFFGPALPEPFVKFQLEGHLKKRKLLPKATGQEGKALRESWDIFRRKLRKLGEQGGDRRVANHVLEPLTERLGYTTFSRQDTVLTREGAEDGGWLLETGDGALLRAWSVALGTDLDAPNRRGRAYRFSPSRVAQRVLLAKSERVGLLTDGEELRLLICDPARPDSHIAVRLDRSGGWRSSRRVPDSYLLLLALASAEGVKVVQTLTEEARLAQSTITKKLRLQARRAVEGFIQELLDHPGNEDAVQSWDDAQAQAQVLWNEGLILVYRLLFVFKLESSADPARAFSFAATSLWRNSYSPNIAMAPLVRRVRDEGADTGGMLEGGLRTLFLMFAEGMSSSELQVSPLGGMLFGKDAIPLIDSFTWGEQAVARLLDHLLWTPGDGKTERERVHYGALDVEDLGRVYEALLELEPGIATEPMCRLRRAKLEVVVPEAQGEPYKTAPGQKKGTKTKVEWIETISEGRFYLRVGLGRKASGSYYTPHPFVRFLVQETLGPQVEERSSRKDPQPGKLLELTVLDPAMGSGHFLVEACRYLGEALYEACRLCDEWAIQADEEAEKTKDEAERERVLARARELRKRVEDLPDPEDELVAYLPSRVSEGEESGLSQRKAEALCRRLVAVHCLYGVDKNPLAVELAKLSLWLESYAEGLPLTFLDHRLVCGDSLTGPFFEHLLTYPGNREKLDDLFTRGLTDRLTEVLKTALIHVQDLEASVGKDVADLERKRAAKEKLDAALEPFKLLAAAWSGGVMLGKGCDNAAYVELAKAVATQADVHAVLADHPRLPGMVAVGQAGLSFGLVFPEVFRGAGFGRTGGFHAVLGNPPWDTITIKKKEWFAGLSFQYLETSIEDREYLEEQILAMPENRVAFDEYVAKFEQRKRVNDVIFNHQKVTIDGDLAGRFLDEFRVFMERNAQLLGNRGFTGVVVPSAFHANEGGTGVRQLFLERMALKCCFSFENRKKLFDIHRSFKFAAVVAQDDSLGTDEFQCAFYLKNLDWLFGERSESLAYSLDFVRLTGGDYLSFLELKNRKDWEISEALYRAHEPVKSFLKRSAIKLTVELNMTKDKKRFTPWKREVDPRGPEIHESLRSEGYLILFEGKTIWQFDDLWGAPPRYLVPIRELLDRPHFLEAARHYRLAYRDISSATNERTIAFCLVVPGVVFGHTIQAPERCPQDRSNATALHVVAFANTYCFDYLARLNASSHVSQFILERLPVPAADCTFLAHSALRLTCNHAGYAPLWTEQLNNAWRESKPKHTWPVLEGDDERWAVRAAIDAVVADAYGLDREQYTHVLSSFSHKSYLKAPEVCLAAYDELKELGLEAFTKKHDPYWDIPLNENLPKPVIDLPGMDETATKDKAPLPLFAQGTTESTPNVADAPTRSHGGRRPDTVSVEDAARGEEAYKAITRLLAERGVITSRDAQEITSLDATRVRPHLQRLVSEGLAVTEGQRRGKKYRRVDHA